MASSKFYTTDLLGQYSHHDHGIQSMIRKHPAP